MSEIALKSPPRGEYVGKYGYLHLIAAVLREPRSENDDIGWLREMKETLLALVKEMELNIGERGKLNEPDDKYRE